MTETMNHIMTWLSYFVVGFTK